MGLCIVVNPLCKTSDTNTGACLSCYQGYDVFAGNCIIPQNNDPYCLIKSGSTCVTCANGYYLFQNVCTRTTKICVTYDMQSGNCTNCNVGSQLINGDCVLTPKSSDPNCAQADSSNRCTACNPNFYLNPTTQVCTFVSILCSKFDYTALVCKECQSGYFLQDGGCIYPSMGEDPLCVHYSGSFCDKCVDRAYI